MKLIRCLFVGGWPVWAGLVVGLHVSAAEVVTFDELPLPGPDTFWNGSDGSGGFTSRGIHFANSYDPTWGSWSGFAYSNVNDPNTPGWGNQYAVISGTGYGGGGQYAVVFDGADVVTLPAPTTVLGFYANNTTYAALSMRDGDAFSKRFGGADGTDPDWFKLTVRGLDSEGQPLGEVEFYLADFRAEDPAEDYIVTDWTFVDLSALGSEVKRLEFDFASTDNGPWGMNTPAYFAMDNFMVAAVPEPTSLALGAMALGLVILQAARHRSVG